MAARRQPSIIALCLVGGAKNVGVLVHIHFLQLLAGRSEIFARIEFGRFVVKHFTNHRRHRQAAIAVDVDLADRALGCSAELFFGDSDGVFQFTAIFVDFLHVLLWNGGRAVQNDREPGKPSFNLFKDIEAERGRYENSLFVDGTVSRIEFVRSMARSDGDRQ